MSPAPSARALSDEKLSEDIKRIYDAIAVPNIHLVSESADGG